MVVGNIVNYKLKADNTAEVMILLRFSMKSMCYLLLKVCVLHSDLAHSHVLLILAYLSDC